MRNEDLKVLGMLEFPERLERYTRAEAGDVGVYANMPDKMEEDRRYIESHNGKYDEFEATQKNLARVVEAWREKLPYNQMQEGQIGRNILRGIGNIGRFISNYTFRPIYGTIGKYVYMPIHSKFGSKGKMYKNRPLHRYGARREYFENQGSNFITSRLKAITSYKEADEAILQNRIEQIRQAEQEATEYSNIKSRHENEIQKLRRENKELRESKIERKYEEWGEIDKGIKNNQNEIKKYQKKLDENLSTKDVLGGEAISQTAHEEANKAKILGVTTLANIGIAIGTQRLIGHIRDTVINSAVAGKVANPNAELGKKMHDMLNKMPEEVRTEKIRQLTLGDYIALAEKQQEVPLQYAVNYGPIKNFPADAIQHVRGLTFETKNGIISMADGNGFDINRYANFSTGRQLNLGDNLWDSLAELLNKAGTNETGNSLSEWFIKLSPEKQREFLSKIDITVSNSRDGIPLGHLDGAKSIVNNMLQNPPSAPNVPGGR